MGRLFYRPRHRARRSVWGVLAGAWRLSRGLSAPRSVEVRGMLSPLDVLGEER